MIIEHYRSINVCYLSMYFSVAFDGHTIYIRAHDVKEGTISSLHMAPYQGCDGTIYSLNKQARDFWHRFNPIKISRLEFLIATGLAT